MVHPPETSTESRPCHRCAGEGESRVRLFGVDDQGRSICRWDTLLCPDCGGLGMIPAEQLAAWERGRRLRADRLRRNMSLRREADLLGISIKQLSDREWGRHG